MLPLGQPLVPRPGEREKTTSTPCFIKVRSGLTTSVSYTQVDLSVMGNLSEKMGALQDHRDTGGIILARIMAKLVQGWIQVMVVRTGHIIIGVEV
jgi:hypothetical protein